VTVASSWLDAAVAAKVSKSPREDKADASIDFRSLDATLWRRIVSNILISNPDDYLRNHGFLYMGYDDWRLSPAYYLKHTPTDPKPRIPTTAINDDRY
jgi:hypothetical protein